MPKTFHLTGGAYYASVSLSLAAFFQVSDGAAGLGESGIAGEGEGGGSPLNVEA